MAEAKQDAPRQTARDKIRAATLGNKGQFKTEVVEVNGVSVAVKQPSVGEREDMFAAIDADAGSSAVDYAKMFKLMTWGVIKLTYVPDTNERVFDDADYDELMNQPTNDWVDQLGETVLEVLNVEADQGKG